MITIGIDGIERFAADSFIFFDKNGKLFSVSEGHIVDEETLAFSSDRINLVDSLKFIGLKDLDPEKYDEEEEIAVFEVSTIRTE